MDSWLSNIESLLTNGVTDIDFPMERWAALSAQNSLKTDLAHRTAEMAGVSETEHINYRSGMVLDTLLTGQDPFQITYESVEGPTAYSLYDSYIFTTFPGMSSRARLRHGSAAEEESGFLYSLKKSWQSIQEIGHDSIDGFKTRGDKAYDSVYDFTNHVTLGISDAIWSGAQDRTAKRKDSVGDYLDYWTLGFTGTIAGAVNPDDPFSSDHLLNSFGLATSFTGGGKVVTRKPASDVSGASKPKEPSQTAGENKATSEITSYYRVQGGEMPNASQVRIQIDKNGEMVIPNKDANLNVSAGTREHAEYFLQRRGNGAGIVEVEVPGISYEFPAPWIEWLEEYGEIKK